MTRKEQIVQTCMDIFSEKGAKGLTMKAIAERVDISEPAIYRHFHNKEAVIIAMIRQVRDELFLRVDEILRRPMAAMEKLERIYDHHLFYLKEKKGITVALLSESFFYDQPEARRYMLFFSNDYHKRIQEVIALGIEKGEIPDTVNPHAASILFMGALQHLVTLFRLTGDEEKLDLISGEVFRHLKKVFTGREET